MRTVLAGLSSQVRSTLGDEFLATEWSRILAEFGPSEALREALKRWSEASPKPLVQLIDEIDTLQGDPLLSTLQQLRAGLPHAPGRLPAVRGPVRTARRARLPHPVHQQPLQHRGECRCGWGTSRRRDVDPPRPAHRGDGAGVHRTTPARRYGPRPWAAVARSLRRRKRCDNRRTGSEGESPMATTFRPYEPDQMLLLAPDVRDWLPKGTLRIT